MRRWRVDQRARLWLRDHFERQLLPYPHVELFFWRPESGPLNFGDYLSRVIAEAAAGTRSHRLDQGIPVSRRMLSIGSILHYARPGDVVWGSGINGRPGQERPGSTDIDVRAVRGPLTRGVLQDLGIAVPEIYGDPALLMPMLLPGRFRPTAEKDVVFVPNLNDLKVHSPEEFGNVDVISPYLPWNQCVEKILSAKLVLSSSLHGLIVAEAYGIPARFIRLGPAESMFKYRDYYAGSGRDSFEFAESVAQGLEMGGERPVQFNAQALLDAFPFDLWGNP